MTALNNYLAEKNISVKDFAKITKIKEKKLKRVLENQAFFSGDEAARVSAFLGVSKNELYHGVVERKGELPEVAEQNNLNRFRYYIKNRFKNARRLAGFLEFIYGCGIFATAVLYIVGMFTSITGLPTFLRSIDTMLLGFLIPVIFIEYFWITAFNKALKKRSVKGNGLKIEGICISVLVLINAIICFAKDFIPVEAFAFTVVGAISLAILSIKPFFKAKPFTKRIVHFFIYSIPTTLLIISSVFTEKYLEKMAPEGEEVFINSLSGATAIMGLVFYLIILGVFCYSLMLFYNIFIEGIGKYFKPMKTEKALSKKRLVIHTLSSVVVCCAIFLGVCASQGLYLKYIYMNVLEGKEDTVNWTADFVTNFESQYKKGEYDIVKFEGMKIKIPKGYSFDKKTEYTSIYKADENCFIMLQKPFYEQPIDYDLFDEDFGEGKLTEEQKEELKEDFIKYFGVYPKNMYEWHKLNGSVTLDDINVFNPRKTALLATTLIMKSVAAVPNSKYYLYENGDLYATIIIHTIENEEKGNREMVSVSFGSPNLEYSITLAHPDQDDSIAIEEVTKILNSINFD